MVELTKLEKTEIALEIFMKKWIETQSVLENIESIIKEWDEVHQRDRHAAPVFLEDVETALSEFTTKGENSNE